MKLYLEMLSPQSIYAYLIGFLEQGGPVLLVIMVATFALWLLIIERHYFFWKTKNIITSKMISNWNTRKDKSSWFAEKKRQRFISLAKIHAEKNISTIKAVVTVAPLLGLLGTVTGMIDVFDVMAVTDSSNSRAMASGVSKATIPTMAGMVVSLSGLLFIVNLQKRANQFVDYLSNEMPLEDKS
ncbi:MAG: MotA/TolQ/ExbB proton channel family protein [Cellvibrionaceae bacterium]